MDDRPHIVIVEDEATQRQLLVDYLSRQNFRVSGAQAGPDLRRIVERDRPALVLLDIGLPGEDGFALARWLRETSGRIGIIMVTAASDTVDRVVGLETGADDYIAKPFEPRELLAREFDLLKVFAEHPNRPLQRDWLLEVTAHREMEPFDRAIDLRITRLRRKIEVDPAHPNAIRTVRGIGYMFVPPTH
jgi:DNA-binding response OmpR family regulator